MLRTTLSLGALLLASCASHNTMPFSIDTQEIAYESGGVPLTGFLARPTDAPGPRPGVIVVHEWWGHNDYVRSRARQLAEAGYVAFALDMYGDGKSASHPQDAQAFMQEVMGNASAMEARFRAALEVLRGADGVDASRTAAIGYCMGGGIVLRMARATDELDAVASFHGSLGAALGAGDAGGTSHYFIAHGGDDPFVPMEDLEQLEAELKAMPATKDIAVSIYAGAKHGFTNPAATKKGEEFGLPLAYDAQADAQSWDTMLGVFRAAFD